MRASERKAARCRRAATTLCYVMVAMVALTALISLAVDFGRVQVAKTELQTAADAAARYAVTGLSNGTTSTKAIAVAAENFVDGSPLVLLSDDVQTITWADGTYTIGGSSPNGVMVTARRAASRGTGIPLLFARLIGQSTCDISATAIAISNPNRPPFGIVGINATMLQNGTITTDSYKSNNGAYGGSNILTNGYVATNGALTMTGGVNISQDVYMVAGQSIIANGGPSYGTRQTLAPPLSYSPVTSYPPAATNLGNVNSGMTLGSPGGSTDYYCTNFNISSGQELNILGTVTLYINGNCNLNGTISTASNLPANFKIRMLVVAGVNIASPGPVYADIYAPTSPININNCPAIYGRLIGSQLSVSQSCAIHYDESLPALPGPPQGPPGCGDSSAISIVR